MTRGSDARRFPARSRASVARGRALARKAAAVRPRSFVIVCRPGGGGTVAISILTIAAEVVATGSAAALLFPLLRVRRGSDGLRRWTPVGELLRDIGRHHNGALDRKALRRQIRCLRRRLARIGVNPDLIETHRTRGVRLAVRPEQVLRVAGP
jgi:hypothetical protein